MTEASPLNASLTVALDALEDNTRRLLARPDLAAVPISEAARELASRKLATLVPARYKNPPVVDGRPLAPWPADPGIRGWIADTFAGERDSLVLIGPTGTGKTHAAWGAITAIVEGWETHIRDPRQRPSVAAWRTVDLLDALRPSRTDSERLATFQLATEAGLVFLDDVAVAKSTEWSIEQMYRVLDHRYAWQLPTIVTCNVPPSVLPEVLGDRLASRIIGLGRRVVLDGADRRLT